MSDRGKTREKTPMPRFEHQDRQVNFSFPKSAASPQHGRKADKAAVKLKEARSFQPRPGH